MRWNRCPAMTPFFLTGPAGAVVTGLLAAGYSVDEVMAGIANVPEGRIGSLNLSLLRWKHVNHAGLLRVDRDLVTLPRVRHAVDSLLQPRALAVGSNQVGTREIQVAEAADLCPAVFTEYVDP